MHTATEFVLSNKKSWCHQLSLTLLQNTGITVCAVSTQLIVNPSLRGPLDLHKTGGSTHHVADQVCVLSANDLDLAIAVY